MENTFDSESFFSDQALLSAREENDALSSSGVTLAGVPKGINYRIYDRYHRESGGAERADQEREERLRVLSPHIASYRRIASTVTSLGQEIRIGMFWGHDVTPTVQPGDAGELHMEDMKWFLDNFPEDKSFMLVCGIPAEFSHRAYPNPYLENSEGGENKMSGKLVIWVGKLPEGEIQQRNPRSGEYIIPSDRERIISANERSRVLWQQKFEIQDGTSDIFMTVHSGVEEFLERGPIHMAAVYREALDFHSDTHYFLGSGSPKVGIRFLRGQEENMVYTVLHGVMKRYQGAPQLDLHERIEPNFSSEYKNAVLELKGEHHNYDNPEGDGNGIIRADDQGRGVGAIIEIGFFSDETPLDPITRRIYTAQAGRRPREAHYFFDPPEEEELKVEQILYNLLQSYQKMAIESECPTLIRKNQWITMTETENDSTLPAHIAAKYHDALHAGEPKPLLIVQADTSFEGAIGGRIDNRTDLFPEPLFAQPQADAYLTRHERLKEIPMMKHFVTTDGKGMGINEYIAPAAMILPYGTTDAPEGVTHPQLVARQNKRLVDTFIRNPDYDFKTIIPMGVVPGIFNFAIQQSGLVRRVNYAYTFQDRKIASGEKEAPSMYTAPHYYGNPEARKHGDEGTLTYYRDLLTGMIPNAGLFEHLGDEIRPDMDGWRVILEEMMLKNMIHAVQPILYRAGDNQYLYFRIFSRVGTDDDDVDKNLRWFYAVATLYYMHCHQLLSGRFRSLFLPAAEQDQLQPSQNWEFHNLQGGQDFTHSFNLPPDLTGMWEFNFSLRVLDKNYNRELFSQRHQDAFLVGTMNDIDRLRRDLLIAESRVEAGLIPKWWQ